MRREQFSQQLPDNRIAAGTADYDALAEGNGILISDSSDHILSGYEYTPQIGDVLHLKTYGGQDMDLNVMGNCKGRKPGCHRRVGVTLYSSRGDTPQTIPRGQKLPDGLECPCAQDSDVLRTQLFQIAENPGADHIARVC